MRRALRDLSMASATWTLYCFGTLAWKWTWLPPKPKVPNSKPHASNSRNAAVQVSMCDCLRKQLYLHFVGNIIVIQLFRVSRAARPTTLKLSLVKVFIRYLHSLKGAAFGGAPTMVLTQSIENLTVLPASHPQVFVELSPEVLPAGQKEIQARDPTFLFIPDHR